MVQGSVLVTIEEEIDGEDVVLTQHLLQNVQAGSLTLSVTPSTPKIKVKFKYHMGGALYVGYSICVKVPHMVSETYLVDVCDETGDKYRFGFNNQEKINEISGIGNSLDFNFRIYDSRLGRFLSQDPLHKDFPWNSNYAFAENDVIRCLDIEGLEKVSIHTVSFAPFDYFGGDFMGAYKGNGNNRKFGDKLQSAYGSENYKIRGQFDVDLTSMKMSNAQAAGSLTKYISKPISMRSNKTAFSTATFKNIISFSHHPGTLTTKFHLAGGNAAIPAASYTPAILTDINVKGEVHFWPMGNGKFGVTSRIYGDRFPSNETYIEDKAGTRVFLGVSGLSSDNEHKAPYTELPGDDNDRGMSSSYFYIQFNADETIKNVEGTDGKKYSPSEWNAQFTNQDPKSTKTGTRVGR